MNKEPFKKRNKTFSKKRKYKNKKKLSLIKNKSLK